MQPFRLIYCSLLAVHVSSDIFPHHQEHLDCIYSIRYYSPMSLPVGVIDEMELRYCIYSLGALDDERKYRSKHVGLTRNNKLIYMTQQKHQQDAALQQDLSFQSSLKGQHASSGTAPIIRSSKLYLQPPVCMPIW